MSIYDIEVKLANGETYRLDRYKGKVMVIVNTASACGLKAQYGELEEIYQAYKDRNVIVLGFPSNQFNQEKGTDEAAANACQINYGVSFPIHAITQVNGEKAHPLFQFLKKEKGGIGTSAIKWNFTKFLVDSEGNVIERFAPQTSPKKLIPKIEELMD